MQYKVRGGQLSQEFWRAREEPQAVSPPWVNKAESRRERAKSVFTPSPPGTHMTVSMLNLRVEPKQFFLRDMT